MDLKQLKLLCHLQLIHAFIQIKRFSKDYAIVDLVTHNPNKDWSHEQRLIANLKTGESSVNLFWIETSSLSLRSKAAIANYVRV